MVEVLMVVLTPLFFVLLATAFMAASHGRPFWRWFGWRMPYLSLFVVHHDKTRLAVAVTA